MYHTDMYHIVHVYLYTHLRMHGCCLAPTMIPNHDKLMSIDVRLFSFCCVLLCFVLHVSCCFFGWVRGTEAYLWCAKYGTLVCWLYVDAWHIICVTWRRVMAESVWALHCYPHHGQATGGGRVLLRGSSFLPWLSAHFPQPCRGLHQLSSALSFSRHVPSLVKAQSYGMVNRRIKI